MSDVDLSRERNGNHVAEGMPDATAETAGAPRPENQQVGGRAMPLTGSSTDQASRATDVVSRYPLPEAWGCRR